jgi:hypothetical protein
MLDVQEDPGEALIFLQPCKIIHTVSACYLKQNHGGQELGVGPTGAVAASPNEFVSIFSHPLLEPTICGLKIKILTGISISRKALNKDLPPKDQIQAIRPLTTSVCMPYISRPPNEAPPGASERGQNIAGAIRQSSLKIE